MSESGRSAPRATDPKTRTFLCSNDPKAGWCYVQNGSGSTPAGNCSQAIVFTAAGQPAGAKISLQCIEKSGGGTDGG